MRGFSFGPSDDARLNEQSGCPRYPFGCAGDTDDGHTGGHRATRKSSWRFPQAEPRSKRLVQTEKAALAAPRDDKGAVKRHRRFGSLLFKTEGKLTCVGLHVLRPRLARFSFQRTTRSLE